MASRGRDIKVAIISDADQFDVDKPAKELERLGEEALDAKRELDELNDATRANDLDKLGDDAKATATKVDNAFEKIAKSSRSNLRKVDNDLDRGKKGLDDFRDEANESGRESAASFTGSFEDVADTIQEVAANAFRGFGALGGAAGLAAAAGLGVLFTKFNEAKEKAKELRQELTSLMIEGNGKISPDSLFDRIKQMAEDGTLADLKKQAEDANLPLRDLARAQAGDMDSAQRMLALVKERIRLANEDPNGNTQQIQRYQAVQGQIESTIEVLQLAADAQRNVAGTAEEATQKQQEFSDRMRETADAKHAEAIGEIGTALRDVGNAQDELATKIDEGKGKIAAKDIVAILNEETKAAESFATNLREAMESGDEAFVAWVSAQGPAVAQAYASGTAASKKTIYDAYRRNVGAQQALGTAQGLTENAGTVTDAAGNIYNQVKNTLTGETILVPVGVEGPSAAEVRAVRASIVKRFGTVTIPVVPKQFGAGRFLPE